MYIPPDWETKARDHDLGILKRRELRIEDLRPLRGRVFLRPLGDAAGRELVTHADGTRRTTGGIIAPETVHDNRRHGAGAAQIHRGVVVAMGPPARTKKGALAMTEYELGTEVYFVFALEGTEETRRVRVGEEGLVVMAQEEIVAVVERGAGVGR